MNFHVTRVNAQAATVVTKDLNAVPAVGLSGRPYEVRALHLRFHYAGVAASTSDAVAANNWWQMLTSIQLKDASGKDLIFENPVSGRALREILHWMQKRDYVDPTLLSSNTNAAYTRDLDITIPLRDEHSHEPDDHLLYAADFKGGTINIGFHTSFGTGHTFTTASSYVDVDLDLVPARKIVARPRRLIGTKQPDTLDRYRLVLNGRVEMLGVLQPASAATAFGATDFVECEIRGDNLDVNRQPVDGPQREYNAEQDYSYIAHALLTGGSALSGLLYRKPAYGRLAECPVETSPVVTITGNPLPALTTVNFFYVISKPVDVDRFAAMVGRTAEFPMTREGVLKALAADQKIIGASGNAVDPNDPMAPWVGRLVNVPVAKANS